MEAQIATASRPYQAYDYPNAQHWFAENDRDIEYTADAADLALGRTIAFLRQRLVVEQRSWLAVGTVSALSQRFRFLKF